MPVLYKNCHFKHTFHQARLSFDRLVVALVGVVFSMPQIQKAISNGLMPPKGLGLSR